MTFTCLAIVMFLGMLLKAVANAEAPDQDVCPKPPSTPLQEAARYILAAGLFGFAGGITNWIAIKMLFDRICNLPGSGVIPMRFKEIRQARGRRLASRLASRSTRAARVLSARALAAAAQRAAARLVRR